MNTDNILQYVDEELRKIDKLHSLLKSLRRDVQRVEDQYTNLIDVTQNGAKFCENTGCRNTVPKNQSYNVCYRCEIQENKKRFNDA